MLMNFASEFKYILALQEASVVGIVDRWSTFEYPHKRRAMTDMNVTNTDIPRVTLRE